MDHDAVSFANALGEHIAPLLLRVRATGFVDAPVYMSVMTALSIPLFIWLKNRLQGNGTLPAMRPRALWLVAYIALLVRARRTAIDTLLGVYVQIALIGGYAIAVYRIDLLAYIVRKEVPGIDVFG